MKFGRKWLFKSVFVLQGMLLSLSMALPVAAQEFPPPERPIHNGVDTVDVKISESDNQGLSAQYTFPDPHLWITTEKTDKEKVNYLQFAIPGMEQAYGEVGKPAVPFYSRLLALPQGAEVSVAEFEVEVGEELGQLLYPVQESPVDLPAIAPAQQEGEEFSVEEYANPPFTINDDFYNGENTYPEQPVAVEVLGEMGNLRLARVSVATAQYNTAKEQLTFYKAVRFKLTFNKGEEHFLTERDMIEFNRPDAGTLGLLLNGDTVPQHVGKFSVSQFKCIGKEYLIITDPLFRAAADTLAAAKQTAGISTDVVETGTGAGKAGTTRTAIKTYIADRYDECLIQLKYVLLLGDAEHIPPWYNRTYNFDTPGSDLEYSLLVGNDLLADVALGRIPVDTLAQANTVVNKIIAYEQSPPTEASFYEDVTLAGYFQCCRPRVWEWVFDLFNPLQLVDGVTSRSFIETAELIAAELDSEGYNINRIYQTSNGYHNNNSTPAGLLNYYNPATRDTTPRRYYNQAPLPSAISPGSGFAWDGSTTDVIDAFNDGSFLIVHRDHGYKNGWGDPDFATSDHGFLTNGNLTPVVYSINCSSGLFDNETRNPASDAYNYNTQVNATYWAEDLLRRSGGAVAVIGDTRNSPTWANSALARGLIDATWPDTVPEGGTARTRRLGKILNQGKLYLLGQVGVAQSAGSVSNHTANGDVLMYHLFGDPTMKMWRQNPNDNIPSQSYTFQPVDGSQWTFNHASEGATLTAMNGNTALARGTVSQGSTTLNFWTERPHETPIQFVLSAADSMATTLPLTQISTPVTKEKGGELTGTDKMLEIAIPPAAVETDGQLILTEMAAPSYPLPDNHSTVDSFLLEVSGITGTTGTVTELAKPATLELCLSEEAQKYHKQTYLAHYSERTEEWVPVDAKYDEESGCFNAETTQVNEFALLLDELGSLGGSNTQLYLPIVTR